MNQRNIDDPHQQDYEDQWNGKIDMSGGPMPDQTETPTPRTDGAIKDAGGETGFYGNYAQEFCRQLEQELDDAHGVISEQTRIANEEMDRHKRELSVANQRAQELAGKVEELKVMCDAQEVIIAHDKQRAEQAEAALATARREERERCAKVCEEMQREQPECPETAQYCADAIRDLPEERK